jgi:hypothetical protein
MPGLLCQADAAACAESLNSAYAAFDEANENSPLGVPMRGRARFDPDGQWYYCTGQCFEQGGIAQPDCYTAAAVFNHKVIVTKDGQLPSATNSQSGSNSFFGRYPVLIIMQPSTTLQRLTKCAWQFDGAAFNRQNGGCGSNTGKKCGDPQSAFEDKCPEDPSKWADETCASTMEAYCGNESVTYETNCYWKGPAFTSPAYAGAKPDFNFADADSNNQIRAMLKNRVSDGNQDGTTTDGLPLLEYWNEISLDGRIIDRFIETQGPQSVIAAFAFARGNGDAIDATSQAEAQKFQDYFKNSSQVTIPLLAIDTISGGDTPFSFIAVGDSVVV